LIALSSRRHPVPHRWRASPPIIPTNRRLIEPQRAQRHGGIATGREIVERFLGHADDVLLDEGRAFARHLPDV
jgi:hypothetical protein